jgi:iron uptake system EfeUOB component EfeO/EfeM
MKEGYEIVAVNYWKFVNNEIKRIMLDFWNTLLLNIVKNIEQAKAFYAQLRIYYYASPEIRS